MFRALCDSFGRAETKRRLAAQLKADIKATEQAIEAEEVLKQKHLHNAEFSGNRIVFLRSNLDSSRRRLAQVQPTAEGAING